MDGAVWLRNDLDNFRRLGRTQQYGAVLARFVLLADACALYLSLYLSVRFLGLDWAQRYVTLALLGLALFGLVTSLRQLHRRWRLTRLASELAELCCLLTLTFAAVVAISIMATEWIDDQTHVAVLAAWFVAAFAGMSLVRAAVRVALRVYRLGPADHRRIAFLGLTPTAFHLADLFRAHPWLGIDVAGFYSVEPAGDDATSQAHATGGLDVLVARARAGEVSAVYIALPMGMTAQLKGLVDAFADTTVSIYYCPTMLDLGLLNARWDDVFGHAVVSIVASPFDAWGRNLKRVEDLCLTLTILPVIAPVLALVALAVKLTSPGPVLYRQTRYGLGGKPFRICKFRTMYTVDADHEFVQARQNDARITPVGRFLRRTSLDELPQFFNVLAGDMSVVGPRPAPVKYNEDHRRVIHRYMVRHKVKPGITGLAQVSGSRGETLSLAKTEERTALDLQYINTWSLWLDLRIVLRTVLMTAMEFRPQ